MTALRITTPSDREVVITRAFDSPKDLVFDALTKPELLKRWYGPTGWSMTVCEIDLKVGGAWRFVVSRPDGKVIGQRGVYKEVVKGMRIVNTEAWEDWDAGETLVTTELKEENGITLFTSTILFPSKDVRDTIVKAGLEHGAEEGYQKLAELLAILQPV
jgi:uncharacterized protein YndB with AHSA1/START domain